MVISFLPKRLVTFLEFIGYYGGSNSAVRSLTRATEYENTTGYIWSSLTLFAYYLIFNYAFYLGEGSEQMMEEVVEKLNKTVPTFCFTDIARGYLERVKGRLESAIDHMHTALDSLARYPQAKKGVYVELAWCYIYKSDWSNSVKYASLFHQEATLSPALGCYIHACVLTMQMDENGVDNRELISKCLKSVPVLNRNFGGQRAFHEKFVLKKAQIFADNVDDFILPILEVMYIWNGFKQLRASTEMSEEYVNKIERKLAIHHKDVNENNKENWDLYAYLTFMQGALLKEMKRTHEATKCFEKVIECTSKLTIDTHLPPQACFEIGLIHRDTGEFGKARNWMNKAKQNYSNYFTEDMIAFRVDHVLDQLKELMSSR